MANSPSEKWKDGVLVQRAIETNRWNVKAVGSTAETEGDEPDAKALAPAQAENKSVKAASKK